jgi:hypothetical protein
MNTTVTRFYLMSILVLLLVIACRRSEVSSVKAASNTEYLLYPLEMPAHSAPLYVSNQVNKIVAETNGRLHSIIGVSAWDRSFIVLEVPKGTLAKLAAAGDNKK